LVRVIHPAGGECVSNITNLVLEEEAAVEEVDVAAPDRAAVV
jgi:hypothetical protein